MGKREPEIYGTLSFEEYLDSIRDSYVMVQLDYFQSNHEGDLIDYLHAHGFEKQSAIVLNAGGYTHTSVALRDAISGIEAPVAEVHISAIYEREPFRSVNLLADVCTTSITGKGLDGYKMAIDHLLAL